MNMRASDFHEHEAERKRESLAGTLAAIHERLTVGQVVDEVLTYAKGNSRTLGIAITNAAKENPLPTLLIGTACALLMADKTGLSARLTESLKHGNGGDPDGPYSSGNADDQGMLTRARAAVSETAEGAMQKAREVMHDTRDRIGESMATLSDTASTSKERVDQMTGQAASAARHTKDTAARVLQEQPLLLAGLGVAVGALVAFLLPRSGVEDRLMGESSDAVKSEVRSTVARQMAAATDVAQTVVGEVRDRIEEKGLTPGAVTADLMRDSRTRSEKTGDEI
jgi:gas vesicle protein